MGLLFNALTAVPRMHLVKSLRVRPMIIMETCAGFVGSATVVSLAVLGYGVWSLMAGYLFEGVLKVIGFAMLTRRQWVWPSLRLGLVRPLLAYGTYRTLEYFAWMVFTSADVLIIGWWLGPSEMGLYSVALNFAGMPLGKVAPIINSVAFPAFALAQGDRRRCATTCSSRSG